MKAGLLILIVVVGGGLMLVVSVIKHVKIAEVRTQEASLLIGCARVLEGERPSEDLAHALQIIDVPPGLLHRDGAGNLVDPWGTPFKIRIDNQTSGSVLEVTSAGPDRKFGTSDDVMNQRQLAKPMSK